MAASTPLPKIGPRLPWRKRTLRSTTFRAQTFNWISARRATNLAVASSLVSNVDGAR